MGPPIAFRTEASPELRGAIVALVERHATLERVVRWALASGRQILNVVQQDEYTQDVIVSYEGCLHLVYDST